MAVYLYPPAPSHAPADWLEKPPVGWQMEAKKAGDRVVAIRTPEGHLSIYNRSGSFLAISRGSQHLKVLLDVLPRGTHLEGEWVRQGDQGCFWIFDCVRRPTPGGWEWIGFFPLATRQQIAFELVAQMNHPNIQPIPLVTENFATQYQEWRDLGDEGVVWKRQLSKYLGHPSKNQDTPDWRKRRFEWDQRLQILNS